MRKTISRLAVASMVACGYFTATNLAAAEEVPVNARIFYHTVESNMLIAPHDPTHYLVLIHRQGLRIDAETGEFLAWVDSVGTVEFNALGIGTSISRLTMTFQDGSTLAVATDGDVNQGTGIHPGTWEYVGGTGAFAGATGEGTYECQAPQGAPENMDAGLICEVTGTLVTVE